MNYLIVALAGSIGAISRYLIYQFEPRLSTSTFPMATVLINLSGCLLAGILFALSTRISIESRQTIALILVGFVGSYTTFSTFGLDNFRLLEINAYGQILLNIVLNVFGGIIMVWVGKTIVDLGLTDGPL